MKRSRRKKGERKLRLRTPEQMWNLSKAQFRTVMKSIEYKIGVGLTILSLLLYFVLPLDSFYAELWFFTLLLITALFLTIGWLKSFKAYVALYNKY